MRKYKVIDLFSGAGGLSEGFRQAGFEIIGAVEIDKDSCNTFKTNFPNAKVIQGDIKEIDIEKDSFGEVDIIIGGPPCQGFSSLNRHNKNLHEDPRNKLFEEYLKYVDYYRPKAILIENVRGILTSKDGYAKQTIENFFVDRNYTIDSRVLDASDFGVPQKRKRAFFLAFRKDIIDNFNFDKINEFKVIEKVKLIDVFKDLIEVETNKDENGQYNYPDIESSLYLSYLKSNSNFIFNHVIKYPSEIVQNRVKRIPQGGNWRNLDESLLPSIRNNRHSNYLKRLDLNDQSITIDTGHDVYFHPIYNRVPTVRESARIQSFKDDFIFTGADRSQLRQVGNAVPPLLSKSLALLILRYLNENN